jgi:hypothetical protein
MEKAMFPILKQALEDQGYEVKAEVLNADIVGKKDDDLIVVEMKTSLTTKLIYQGLKRSHICDYIYLAIPKPSQQVLKSSNFKEKKTIVRRLELGLILVDLNNQTIDVLLDPTTYHFKKNKKKRQKLLKDLSQRQTSLNVGGVTKTKIITAYRELALLVLDALKDEPKTTQYLRTYTRRKKVTSILQKNYYGWFERVSRGVYQLTESGRKALDTYHDVIIQIKENHPTINP